MSRFSELIIGFDLIGEALVPTSSGDQILKLAEITIIPVDEYYQMKMKFSFNNLSNIFYVHRIHFSLNCFQVVQALSRELF